MQYCACITAYMHLHFICARPDMCTFGLDWVCVDTGHVCSYWDISKSLANFHHAWDCNKIT